MKTFIAPEACVLRGVHFSTDMRFGNVTFSFRGTQVLLGNLSFAEEVGEGRYELLAQGAPAFVRGDASVPGIFRLGPGGVSLPKGADFDILFPEHLVDVEPVFEPLTG